MTNKLNIDKHIKNILKSYKNIGGINHIDGDNLPSRGSIEQILNKLKEILFPGYFENLKLEYHKLPDLIGQKIINVSELLYEEILKSICWDCSKSNNCFDKTRCEKKAKNIINGFLEYVPELRKTLKEDASAALKEDPAAKSESEIILAYPGFHAISAYRIAHYFYKQKVPLIPRLMTELVHNETGIDIHPGANISNRFYIDHGTGVVIGETAIIGTNVKLFQGVTIGALSASGKIKEKRHPTIGNNVTIYAGTTILGGDTVIGDNCVIGGNVWLISSIPENSKIYLSTTERHIIKNISN